MKIAIFYPKNTLAGWGAVGGYAAALDRMGHDVIDVQFPGNQVHEPEAIMKKLPSLEVLESCDTILSMHHEYTYPWLAATYSMEKVWSKIKHKVTARFDESMDRLDLGLMRKYGEMQQWATYFSFPAAQDAERYGGQWLPHGVDTEMFKPHEHVTSNKDKEFDLAFIGSIYPLRGQYYNHLAPCLGKVQLKMGMVMVQELNGLNGPKTMELLADNYRKIKVFFCLPPMSRLIVAKAFEVMACGTFLMYPKLPGITGMNNDVFIDGKHCVYYEQGYFADNAKQIVDYLFDDKKREVIAREGCEFVRENHSYEKFFDYLLAWKTTPEEKMKLRVMQMPQSIELPPPAGVPQ